MFVEKSGGDEEQGFTGVPLGLAMVPGDRVTRQSLGLPAFVVPGPLPPRIQRTDTYTRAELEQFTVPNANLEGLLRRTMDYEAYKERYLAISLGVERELQRRVAEAEAVRAASKARVGEERGRDGRFERGRGRSASSLGRGRGGVVVPERAERSGAGALGAVGRDEEGVSVTGQIPDLRWEINARDQTGTRVIVDIPRLPRPEMHLPVQILREWAESTIMKMLGMRKLLRDCAKGKTLQTRLALEPNITPAVEPPQMQVQTRRMTRAQSQAATGSPVPGATQAKSRQFELRARSEIQRQSMTEESGETKESEESLGASDSDLTLVCLILPMVTAMMTMMVVRVRREKTHRRRNHDMSELLLLC